MYFHCQSLTVSEHGPVTYPYHPPGFYIPENPVRHGILFSPVVLPETQGKVYIDRNKLLRRSSSGRSCTISGVPGWMQPEAGSICTAGTEVPFCRRYVVRCTVNLVNPRSGSVRTGVNEINSQVSKKIRQFTASRYDCCVSRDVRRKPDRNKEVKL